MSVTIFDKIYGCLAATRIASSMGAPPEGMSMEKIADTLDALFLR